MKAMDLSGKVFGKLTVLYRTDQKQQGSLVWHCRCECGNEIDVSARKLTTGNTRSCGCIRKANDGKKAVDLTGKRFGRLKVISITDKRISNSVVWKCVCDCGNVCEVNSNSLVQGLTHSCGCLKKENDKLNQIRVISSTLSKKKRSSNTSGVIGVCYDNSAQKWLATIGFNGKDYYLARCENKDEAINIRRRAEEEILKPFLKEFVESNIPENSDELIKQRIKELRKKIRNNL